MKFEINKIETSGPSVGAFLDCLPVGKVLLSICPYSFMANKKFLNKFFPWVAARAHNVHIFIGDYLERHNVMVKSGASEEEALEAVRKTGDKIRSTFEAIARTHDLEDSLTFLDLFAISKEPAYQRILASLYEFAESDLKFKLDIEALTKTFVELQLPEYKSQHDAVQQLSHYTFEELAFYLYFYLQGLHIEVYPGPDLKVLQKIFNGKYVNFPIHLPHKRTHISVKQRKGA